MYRAFMIAEGVEEAGADKGAGLCLRHCRKVNSYVLGDYWGPPHSLYLFPYLHHLISICFISAPLLKYCLLLTVI